MTKQLYGLGNWLYKPAGTKNRLGMGFTNLREQKTDWELALQTCGNKKPIGNWHYKPVGTKNRLGKAVHKAARTKNRLGKAVHKAARTKNRLGKVSRKVAGTKNRLGKASHKVAGMKYSAEASTKLQEGNIRR